MAYMNQEKKAKIAKLIKPLLKEYGIKGSLAVRHNSTIVLNIAEGPIDFIGNCDAVRKSKNIPDYNAVVGRECTYLQVNTYHVDSHFSGIAAEFLNRAVNCLQSADWYDRSDIQVDYFDTAYHISINIGHWDKPYRYTGV